MSGGIKLSSHLQKDFSFNKRNKEWLHGGDVFVKFLLVARNRILPDLPKLKKKGVGAFTVQGYKGSSWNLSVESTAEPNEKLEARICCQTTEVTITSPSVNKVYNLCYSLCIYLHFYVWNGYSTSEHGCYRKTSSTIKPTPPRSKADHWRLTKTSESQFQTPEEGIWVSQLWSGVSPGRISNGKSRSIVYNKQSGRSHCCGQRMKGTLRRRSIG